MDRMIQLMQHQIDVLEQTKEIYVPIHGYETKYTISNLGNVKSMLTGVVLKPHIKNGYLAVNLYNGKPKHYYVHRLVANAFLDNKNGLSEVNHKDCNKFNNCVDNLEWCDRKANLLHSYIHGKKRKGENHGMHKLTIEQVNSIRCEYVKGSRDHSLHALGKKYGVSWCTIQAIVTNKHWVNVNG
jgi:hypothetical protein